MKILSPWIDKSDLWGGFGTTLCRFRIGDDINDKVYAAAIFCSHGIYRGYMHRTYIDNDAHSDKDQAIEYMDRCLINSGAYLCKDMEEFQKLSILQ